MGWTAILMAGQRPGADPLATHFGESWKALVRVGGEAMLSRSAKALLASPGIERILVLAQERAPLIAHADTAWMATHPRIDFAESGSSISRGIAAVAGSKAAPWPVLVTTADHALLTPEIVAAFLQGVRPGDDVSIAMVERRTLRARYPENKRTWLKFRDGAYSGANLFALTSARAQAALDLWASVEQDRKKGRKIVAAFGPWLLLRALTRSISLPGALEKAGARLGLRAGLVALPIAEAAIDVDKPSDHALAEAILAGRS